MSEPPRPADPERVLHVAERDPRFVEVLETAARAQRLVPDSVVASGTAASLWANHRASYGADHVVADLRDRLEMVLEALEQDEGWATNRLVPGKAIRQ